MKYSGKVKKSMGRGRDLGFPTANIEVPESAEEGIFFAWVIAESKQFASLFFVGEAITFGETNKQGEAYILDFDQDLYDQEIEVEVIEKLRDNERFESPEELVVQMRDDEKAARAFFEKLKK